MNFFLCFTSLSASDVIATSAALIALASMVATFLQAIIARKHNRLSVRPHLDYVIAQYPDKPVSLTVVNHGLGPAIIKQLTLSFQGVDYILEDSNLPQPISSEFINRNVRVKFTLCDSNSPFPVGGSLPMLEFIDSVNSAVARNAAIDLRKQFGFKMEYQSMYNEQFTLVLEPKV